MTLVRPRMEPTEISISRVMIKSVIGSMISARSAALAIMVERLNAVRKSGLSHAPTAKAMMQAQVSSRSQESISLSLPSMMPLLNVYRRAESV